MSSRCLHSFCLRALWRRLAPSPEARRDEIAKVAEMLADPDPLMRLTNMEAIVKSGDTLKLQVAFGSRSPARTKTCVAWRCARTSPAGKKSPSRSRCPRISRLNSTLRRSDPIAERAFRAKYPYVVYLAQYAERFQAHLPGLRVRAGPWNRAFLSKYGRIRHHRRAAGRKASAE